MIHPTAVVGKQSEIGENVSIGPYTVVDGHVEISNNCRIGPHCHLSGYTRIGSNTQIHAGAVIGDEPQDHSFQGAISYTEIGENCIIREYVTIHRGAKPDSKTIIGDRTMLMGFVHVGHNCIIGHDVNVANNTLIAGHVAVGDHAFISAGVGIHQFVRIGQYAMVGAMIKVVQDIPPYCLLAENNRVSGVNSIGLRRAGFAPTVRGAIKETMKLYFFSGLNGADAVEKIIARYGQIGEITEFIDFIRGSTRGTVSGVKI